MKKIFVAILGLMLLAPFSASAVSIGVASLDIDGTDPNVSVKIDQTTHYWAGDYDIVGSTLGNWGLKLNSNEVFCTENADLITYSTPYAFYRIDDALDTDYTYGDAAYIEKLKKATWLANSGYNSTEANKAISQLAIWNVMFGAVAQTYSSQVATLLTSYDSAADQDDYVKDWLLAVSPATITGEIKIGVTGQNFLVKASAPVPEPTTMILFGTGLVGLAGLARRKRN